MADPVDAFDLLDDGGQVIGRAEAMRDRKGEPTIRIVRADGRLHAEFSGAEVRRLGEMIRRLAGGAR